jgi:hypothetical protein
VEIRRVSVADFAAEFPASAITLLMAHFSSLLLNILFMPALPQNPLRLFADCTNNMELTLPPLTSTFATLIDKIFSSRVSPPAGQLESVDPHPAHHQPTT